MIDHNGALVAPAPREPVVTLEVTASLAQTLAELARDEAEKSYEIACGNWGRPESPADRAELYRRHDELAAFAEMARFALDVAAAL